MRNSLEGNRARVKKHTLEKMAYIHEWKSSGCEHCGEKDIVVLEADHIDPSTKHILLKTKGRSKSLYALSWANLRKELTLCRVLCANCHRRVTHQARQLKGVI